MVRSRYLMLTLVLLSLAAPLIMSTSAARTFHLEHEWVKIWINEDGTIDLFYNITLTLDSGDNINYATIGQPQPDFTIGEALDQYGNSLVATDASSSSDYKVKVAFQEPLKPGETIWLTLTTKVGHMLYENQQNVDMQFTPTWWSDATVRDLRILIVLPANVALDNVTTPPSYYWNSSKLVEDNRWSLFWDASNLEPDARYPVGVSFPKEFVQNYEKEPGGITAFLMRYGPLLIMLGIFVVVIAVVTLVFYFVRKNPYLMPTLSMESLGIKHGLTAVEASYLLDLKPERIVAEIVYSLLQKRAVWVESTIPSLKLRIIPRFQDKTGTEDSPLRYYEIDFLSALKDDGTLEEEKLAQTVMLVRDTVEEKMHGYCRRDTIDYYRSVVEKAWQQVEQAGTADLASKAYDEQLLWLILDSEYQTKTQTAFHDRAFEPSPTWLWFWYGYQHYHPHPTYKPNVDNPSQAAKPPTIPGADLANNVATAIETTSNNIVVNLEKFANSILPAPTSSQASHEPAHHGATCVCACAACACACACVSCACACAGGGVG